MKEKQKRSGKKIVLSVILVILLLILLVAAGAAIFVDLLLDKINKVDPQLEHTISSSAADDFLYNDPDLVPMDPSTTETYVKLEEIPFVPMDTQPSAPPDETLSPTEPVFPPEDIYGDHLVNIMLIGQDRAPGQGRQRSDTMILVSINKSTGTITLTSFMRDQYVQIPGYKPNKLNAAFAFGGMNLLKKTLELNFGVKVDGMVEVDFSGFEGVVDLLGGVEVTLTKPEAKYLNDLYDAKFLDSPVVVGLNRLDGEQALVYARLREIDNDYARAGRQRAVITAIFNACKNLPADQLMDLLNQVLPLVSTDLSNSQILSCAMDLLPMLPSAQLNTFRIPVDGSFVGDLVEVRDGFYGWFQYNIDFAANRDALYDIFRRAE